LIQFFPWLLYTNYLFVQSIWLRNEAYILFSCCVAWSIIDTIGSHKRIWWTFNSITNSRKQLWNSITQFK
jgi:hypothetical protein